MLKEKEAIDIIEDFNLTISHAISILPEEQQEAINIAFQSLKNQEKYERALSIMHKDISWEYRKNSIESYKKRAGL